MCSVVGGSPTTPATKFSVISHSGVAALPSSGCRTRYSAWVSPSRSATREIFASAPPASSMPAPRLGLTRGQARPPRLLFTSRSRTSTTATGAADLDGFAQTWAARYPAIVRLWRTHWVEFVPFLAFPPAVRRVIYTTNLIESINARLRKVTRNRGQFPSEQAALKVLYLAVRNLDEYRSASVGTRSSGWKQALQAFTIYFEGRIPTP